jgi:hypothetical protein
MDKGQTVTIPLAEYRALMEDRAELVRVRGLAAGPVCFSSRARFRGDPEVVAFLNENATTASVEWLRDEAQRRFGPARAPSRSAIGRYVRRVRVGLGIGERRNRRRPTQILLQECDEGEGNP